jgi:hypothetical protein
MLVERQQAFSVDEAEKDDSLLVLIPFEYGLFVPIKSPEQKYSYANSINDFFNKIKDLFQVWVSRNDSLNRYMQNIYPDREDSFSVIEWAEKPSIPSDMLEVKDESESNTSNYRDYPRYVSQGYNMLSENDSEIIAKLRKDSEGSNQPSEVKI